MQNRSNVNVDVIVTKTGQLLYDGNAQTATPYHEHESCEKTSSVACVKERSGDRESLVKGKTNGAQHNTTWAKDRNDVDRATGNDEPNE